MTPQPPRRPGLQRNTTPLCLPLWWVLATWLALSAPAHAQHSDVAREARLAKELSDQLVLGEWVSIGHGAQSPGSTLPNFGGIHAPGQAGRPALLLAHGVGAHPDDGLTGQLRQRLNDMGYTTLSIQMPIAAKDAQLGDYFPKLFPEAGERLHSAAAWLRARGHTRVVVVSHTMGSWMANVHFDERLSQGDSPALAAYQAWVCISLTGGYSWATRRYPFPVLDLYGEQDIGVTVSSAWRRKALLASGPPNSRQVMVSGADAQWRQSEQAAAAAIDEFLRQVLP